MKFTIYKVIKKQNSSSSSSWMLNFISDNDNNYFHTFWRFEQLKV